MEDAGLTDLLKQEGDFTLFAPSDKAFASLSDSDLALLRRRSPRFPLSFNVFQAFKLLVENHTK